MNNVDKRIRFLKDFMLPVKGKFMICFLIMLITILGNLYFPMGIQRCIDNGIIKGDLKSLLFEISVIAFVGVSSAVLNYIKFYKITELINIVIFGVKYKIMETLQKCSMKFFSNSKPGAISSIVERDVEQIGDCIFTVLSSIIIRSCSYLAVLVILFFMNWKVGLYALLVSPLLAFFQLKIGKRIKKVYKKVRENIAEINDFTQEWIENIVNIQLFNYSKTISSKYKDKQWRNIKCFIKSARISGVVSVFGQTLNTFGMVMILYFGGIDVLHGQATVGAITSLTIYIQRVYSPLSDIMNGIIQIQNSTVILDRIYSLIECKDVIKDGDLEIKDHLEGNIKIENVTFNYGENDVLRDFNMNINKGDIVGIVGKNGTGKSTIAKMLSRLYDSIKGSIYIDGVDIKKYKVDELRNELIYVQATPYIFHGTIKENILLDKYEDYSEEKLNKIIDDVGLKEDIDNMEKGLDTILYSHSTNLSTGQCQKISIARTLVKNPSIVILDEPTSALDLSIEKEISNVIKNAFKGKTLIIISHRDEILKICNKIYEIENLNIREKKKIIK